MDYRRPEHPFSWTDWVFFAFIGAAVLRLAQELDAFWIPLVGLWGVAACYAFRKFMAPYDWIRPPTIPRTNRGQRPTEFPPPFPNGWFMLCRSPDLKNGEVRKFDVLGEHLVLLRNYEGNVGALEAWCPHLGANLAVGGIVNASTNCLRCPFHGWEFDIMGVCTSIEGTGVIPAGSNIKCFPTREVHGCIYVWFDAEGQPPQWELEVIPEVQSGKWYLSGRTVDVVHAHIQEIPENGSDAAHLNVLHKNFVWERLAAGVSHGWSCAWQPNPNEKHKSQIQLGQNFYLGGWKIPGSQVDACIEQHGPGIVKLMLETPIGKVVAFENVTPIKPTSQLVQHVMYCSPTVPRFIGRFLLWALEEQFSRDIPIWEAKKFLPKPKLSKADGPITAFRRWYSQFYSTSSLSFADATAKENMIDW